MEHQTLDVLPGRRPGQVRTKDGENVRIPADWVLLPPGDATLTKRVKAAGPSWTVKEKKGRRTFSRGVWAPAETIAQERERLDAERETPAYQQRLTRSRERSAAKQEAYVEDFHTQVLSFLSFDARFEELATRLAEAVTAHATPVGSGTVARTERIPVEERAEAAVIAWMRHQTTAYDHMSIARVRGMRRAVRRQLATRSRQLLQRYRDGADVDPETCPLQRALSQS